ncbi:hypothetical protein [Chryseobacterium sp. CT-SW4]|uniref:hypothetical protein n=1 Tax=Chryseobacterium sp. SW-1 TaxID=3157343 RepID=UPI003B02255E
MVDKIKFIVEDVLISEDFLEEKKKYSGENKKKNRQWFVFDYKKLELLHFFRYQNKERENDIDPQEQDDDIEYLDQDQRFVNKNYKNLSIVFVRPLDEKKGKLIIHQNLRKDYLRVKNKRGKNILNDLTYKDFEEIVNLYSRQFKIPGTNFWNARITKIELGATMVFNGNMSTILSCFGTCPNVGEKFIYGNSGISYKAENFSISIYDKLKRVLQNKELLETLTKTRREEFRKIVLRHFFYLRFELKVETVSKFNQTAFKGKINTLRNLRDHWDKVADSLHDLAGSLSFVDFLSPEIEETLLQAKLNNSKSKKDFDDFMYYLAIKSQGGLQPFNTYIADLLHKGIKSSYMKKLEGAYERFVKKEKNKYFRIFDKKFETKIKTLKKSKS